MRRSPCCTFSTVDQAAVCDQNQLDAGGQRQVLLQFTDELDDLREFPGAGRFAIAG